MLLRAAIGERPLDPSAGVDPVARLGGPKHARVVVGHEMIDGRAAQEVTPEEAATAERPKALRSRNQRREEGVGRRDLCLDGLGARPWILSERNGMRERMVADEVPFGNGSADEGSARSVGDLLPEYEEVCADGSTREDVEDRRCDLRIGAVVERDRRALRLQRYVLFELWSPASQRVSSRRAFLRRSSSTSLVTAVGLSHVSSTIIPSGSVA